MSNMKVKNWEKFQHFKDRRPPWVKLYRDILDDIEWHELSGDDAKILVMIWLIASEDFGNLPDAKTLAFRLRMTVKQLDTALSRLGHWLVTERYQPDIKLSQINSVAEVSDHQETETETEKDIYVDKVQSVVDAYHKALPELPSVKLMSTKRKASILKYWDFVMTSKKSDGSHRATNYAEAMEWIESYFMRVRDNPFLMGKIGRVGDHAGWECDLDYLMTERGMAQVIEKTREAA